MFPPTPTAWALPPIAPVTLPVSSFRIWAFADDAIMVWNTAPNSFTQVIQVAAIVAIIIGAVYLLIRYVRQMTSDGDIS